MGNLCVDEIKDAINSLRKLIPAVKYMVSPVLDTTYELQKIVGNANLIKDDTVSSGFWNTCLFDSNRTGDLHTENTMHIRLLQYPSKIIIQLNITICPCLFTKKGSSAD